MQDLWIRREYIDVVRETIEGDSACTAAIGRGSRRYLALFQPPTEADGTQSTLRLAHIFRMFNRSERLTPNSLSKIMIKAATRGLDLIGACKLISAELLGEDYVAKLASVGSKIGADERWCNFNWKS
jgi:hypothetical protein